MHCTSAALNTLLDIRGSLNWSQDSTKEEEEEKKNDFNSLLNN